MDPIIPICKFLSGLALLAVATPTFAAQDASDLYWNAQRQELAGKSGEALKSYARLLAASPQSEAAANNLLAAALREGSMTDAVAAVRAAQKAGVAETDAPLLIFVDAFRRKKWREAESAIAQIEESGNFAFAAPILKAWLNVAQGRPSGFSTNDLQASGLTAYYGDDHLIYFEIADGNLAQAKLRLRNFRGYGDPYGRALAYHTAGAFAASDNDFAMALARQVGLENATYSFPKLTAEIGLAALFARLGLALDEQKQPEKALYFTRLANWVAPESDAAKLAFSEIAGKLEMAAKAKASLETIGSNSPFWLQAVFERSRLADSPEAGVAIAQSAVAVRPNSSQLKMLLAQYFERAGQRERAIPVYRSLLDLDRAGSDKRQRAVYLLLLASALDANGDWGAARNALEDAVEADPQNAQVLNYLGYSLLERRIDVKRGFELVSRAHALSPQSAAITDSLGWAHYLKGDLASAIPLLERAVAAAIDDVAINEHLGDAYWAAGRKTEARFAWKAAALLAEGAVAERIAQKIDLGWTTGNAAP